MRTPRCLGAMTAALLALPALAPAKVTPTESRLYAGVYSSALQPWQQEWRAGR